MRRVAPVQSSSGALLIAALAAGCATTGSGAGGGARSQQIGEPIPDIVLTSLTGNRQISLAKLRGKVVLLDIWASWCPPCKDEMPVLDGIAQRLRGQGVEIVAVSVDDERADAEAFLATRPRWSLTAVFDPQGKVVGDLLSPAKMPTSYVIDARGVVREINSGFEPADGPRIEARLRELAAAR